MSLLLRRRGLLRSVPPAPTWDEYVASLGPVAWWPLEDGDYFQSGSINLRDASGNGRSGRFIGDETPVRMASPLVQTARWGVNVGDGMSQEVRSLASSAQPFAAMQSGANGSFTFGFAIKGTTATSISDFVTGGPYLRVGLNYNWPTGATTAGAVSWLASTAGADAHGLGYAAGWNDGDPHLVLFEYDGAGDTVSIWFDGVEVATKSHAGITMPTGTHTNSLYASVGSASVDWVLDEYLFFDRVLTGTEHTTLASYVTTAPAHPYGASWSPPYNTASHLEIPVPGAASTEAMHPDVVDFGTAWNGYRYWMAFTPYNGDAQTEEPCVVATNDISTDAWEVPTGGSNPVTADPSGTSHPSDTDLVYDPATDRLYLLYVMDDGSSFQDIRSKWTDDGITWSAEATVLAGAAGTYGNPSCIKTSTGFRLYYNIGNTGGMRYRDTTGAPDTGYGSETTCTFVGAVTTGPTYFQNLNMVYDTDGTWVAVISDAKTSGGNGGRLYFARSSDGTQFTLTGPPVLKPSASGWDQTGIYRSTVMTDPAGVVVIDTGFIDVWYSGYTAGSPSLWGTAHIQLPRGVLSA